MNTNAGPYYGWMRVVLENDGSTGLIRDWAYENSGAAITVPEPASSTLLGVCAALLTVRRRRN
jgi:hypothetical protein